MKKLLGFICAILITIFAVMPNTYAEAQKDYGNLDMNRWVVIGSNDDSDVLIDKMSIDYKVDYKNHLLCNFWVCYFFYNEDKYTLENTTINYEEKTLSVDAFADYYKSGGLKIVELTHFIILPKSFLVLSERYFIWDFSLKNVWMK